MKISRLFFVTSIFIFLCVFTVTAEAPAYSWTANEKKVKAFIYDFNNIPYDNKPYEGEVGIRRYASSAEKDKDKYTLWFYYDEGISINFTLSYNKMLQFLQDTLYGEINYDLRKPKVAQSYSWDIETTLFGEQTEHNVLKTYYGKNYIVFDVTQITKGVINAGAVQNFDISGEERLRVWITHNNYKKLINHLIKIGGKR